MLLCHRHLSEFQIFTPFVDRNPGDGASATPTGQAPENVALMETAQEYLDATADTSQTLCNAEFFTCPEAQPSLRSDLNDGSVPHTLVAIDENDSVDLERKKFIVEKFREHLSTSRFDIGGDIPRN